MVGAARRIGYLMVLDAGYSANPNQMARIDLVCRDLKVSPEIVVADLKLVWQVEVAGSATAIYKIVDSLSGFDFLFTLVYETGEYMTGRYSVEFQNPARARRP